MPLKARAWALLLLVCTSCSTRPPLPGPVQPLALAEEAEFRKRPPMPPTAASDTLQLQASAARLGGGALANGLTLWAAARPADSHVHLAFVSRSGTLDATCSGELLELSVRAVATASRLKGVSTAARRSFAYSVTPSHIRFELTVERAALAAGISALAQSLQNPQLARSASWESTRTGTLKRIQDRSGQLHSGLRRIAIARLYGRELAERIDPVLLAPARDATPEAALRCYADNVTPERSALIAVGEVTENELRTLADAAFGSWRAAASVASRPAAPAFRAERRIVHWIPADDSQARVLVLQPAPPGSAAQDQLPFELMSSIAVGAFDSRANVQLRHTTGLTYGVHLELLTSQRFGAWFINGAFDASDVAVPVSELLALLAQLRATLVSPAELEQAKQLRLLRWARENEHPAALAATLVTDFALGRGADWHNQLPAAISAVTAADVQRVANAYLRLHDVQISVAGSQQAGDALSDIGELHRYRAELR